VNALTSVGIDEWDFAINDGNRAVYFGGFHVLLELSRAAAATAALLKALIRIVLEKMERPSFCSTSLYRSQRNGQNVEDRRFRKKGPARQRF
jgi:hypothetical protein